MNYTKAKYDYGKIKYSATVQRGITFKFTLEEWIKWWADQLGPDWQKKRGRGKGKYVMARFEDKGSYELGNVKCILHGDNISEGVRGEKHGACKFTDAEVLEIYHSKEKYKVIAAKYGVRWGSISRIKNKQSRQHLTKDLPWTKRKYGGPGDRPIKSGNME